jgi:hypothetical protein
MANTTVARPLVASTAPNMSTEPRRAGADGISDGVSASASSATGMLMKKTHGQVSHSAMTPPRNTPAVPPAGAAAP